MTAKQDVAIDEQIKIDIRPPKLWKVLFLNDNVTPMDLVVDLLTVIFKHSIESAKKITLEIHNTGSGVAGTYPYELAEQLSVEAKTVARKNGSPLKIQMEEE